MLNKEHLDNFSEILKKILNEEIKLGNKIVGTHSGWPYEQSIIVFLDRPFIGKYNYDNIEYHDVSDPHFWNEEFIDKSTQHLLACNFEPMSK